MTADQSMTTGRQAEGVRIELVEVGGRGGVYQHSVALAQLMATHGATPPLLHTATDHEDLGDRVDRCTCFTWLRHARRLRGPRITLAFLLGTLPHLVRGGRRVVWMQGVFKPALTLLLLAVLRLRGCTTVFSPHNLFSRSAGLGEEWLIGRCVLVAHHVVVYNAVDRARLAARGRSAWLLPLVQVAPPVPPETTEAWRRRLPADRPVVSAVGQIRADKNLPLLLEAAAKAGVSVVVVGPDTGGLTQARACADALDVDAHFYPGYHPLVDLGAVIALTGVVACPYAVASQSGVARLARAYGAVIVASDVGGLREEADVVIEHLTPEAVAAGLLLGIERLRGRSSGAPAAQYTAGTVDTDAVTAFLGALLPRSP